MSGFLVINLNFKNVIFTSWLRKKMNLEMEELLQTCPFMAKTVPLFRYKKKMIAMTSLKTINKIAIPLIVTAHIVSALYYLSIPMEVKNSVDMKALYSLWFFGSEFMVFIPIMLYLTTYINPKSELDTDLINIEIGHILLRGVIYSLHYSGLVHTDSRHRLVFFLGYVFLQCINLIRKAACK